MPETVMRGVEVEIEDVTGPHQFGQLSDAVRALWQSLRTLPLGNTQYEAYRVMFGGADAVERVAQFLDRDGRLELTFSMAGRSHQVRICPTDGRPR